MRKKWYLEALRERRVNRNILIGLRGYNWLEESFKNVMFRSQFDTHLDACVCARAVIPHRPELCKTFQIPWGIHLCLLK